MVSKGNASNIEYLIFKYPDKTNQKDKLESPKIQYLK